MEARKKCEGRTCRHAARLEPVAPENNKVPLLPPNCCKLQPTKTKKLPDTIKGPTRKREHKTVAGNARTGPLVNGTLPKRLAMPGQDHWIMVHCPSDFDLDIIKARGGGPLVNGTHRFKPSCTSRESVDHWIMVHTDSSKARLRSDLFNCFGRTTG